MFRLVSSFDGDISEWNVSRVTTMDSMFSETSFDGDISGWDVSSVYDMTAMFIGAKWFTGDISKWDVSRVKKMDYMFQYATLFRHKLCGAAWVHSKASTNLMFEGSSASVTDKVCATTSSAFSPQSTMYLQSTVETCLKISPEGDCSDSPHGPIGEWDVSRITDMNRMFSSQMLSSVAEFNSDVSNWDVSRVTNVYAMFWGAASFNSDLCMWDVPSVTDMDYTFFHAAAFQSDISKWDVSRVQGMYCMFWGAELFDSDISKWDVSHVRNMANMFYGARSFNSDMSEWNVSSVKDMDHMFRAATSFQHKLSRAAWVNSKASKHEMFEGSSTSASTTVAALSRQSKEQLKSAVNACLKYSQKGDCETGLIGKWDVSRVTDMSRIFSSQMLSSAAAFNADISKWDVSRVMYGMFWGAESLIVTFRSGTCQA